MKKRLLLVTEILVLANLSMFGKKNDIDLKVNQVEDRDNIYSVDRFF